MGYRQKLFMAASLCHSLQPHTIMQQALLIIPCIFFIIYAVLIIYYLTGWVTIPVFIASASGIKPGTKLSIIIPARNEEQHIGPCLQSIINQSYPKELVEIIVVDDHSTDNTVAVVFGFNQPNIKLIALKDFVSDETNSYKKKAIEVGIAQSTGELIITTDADCIAPGNWLQTIAAFYQEKKPELIVMPVSILPSPSGEGLGMRSLIALFQAVDFMTLQGITGAAVNKKMHSMCNGANLAYTKKAFTAVNGFAGINAIASGDDMLLMHKIYTQFPDGIAYLKSKEVIVQTSPVKTIGEFFNQRIRWASKADKYDDKRILPVLIAVYFFNVLLLILPLIAFFEKRQYSIFNIQYTMMEVWLWLLLLKIITESTFLFPVAKFFGKQKLLWLFPLLQPFHILYTIIAGWLGKFGSYQWKGRKVK